MKEMICRQFQSSSSVCHVNFLNVRWVILEGEKVFLSADKVYFIKKYLGNFTIVFFSILESETRGNFQIQDHIVLKVIRTLLFHFSISNKI